eukprot:COSAG03_NODE_478_length_7595_cov_4.439568_6_plen_137_part_00
MARVWAKALMPTLPKRAAPSQQQQSFGLFAQAPDPVPQTPNCAIPGSTAMSSYDEMGTEDTAARTAGHNQQAGSHRSEHTMHAKADENNPDGGPNAQAPAASACTHMVTVNASSGGKNITHAYANRASALTYVFGH